MEKITELYESLYKAQTEFPVVKKTDNNPFFKSSYAGLPNILEVVLPILHKHNLFIIQSPISNENQVGVRTSLCHSNGQSYTSEFTLPLAKNDPQGAGSAITYARRYALVSMLGLNVDDDDDGNEASKPVVPVTGGIRR